MTDPVLGIFWVGVLALGVGLVMLLRARGLPPSYARDLLHVGAGVWVVGWPWWDGVLAPVAIVGTAALAVALVPMAANKVPAVHRFRSAVAEGDERFSGLVLYTVSFAIMTVLGMTHSPFPAAAALLALALGDGLGGLVGRQFGRRFYSTALGKRKSLEGSAAVAMFAGVGVLAAAGLFDVEVPARALLLLGLVAAAAEGLAPRGSDNIAVPAAVWVTAELVL